MMKKWFNLLLPFMFVGFIVRFYGISANTENADAGIRAVYIAANLSDVSSIINQAKKLRANAVIIDIKDDFGKLTCEMKVPGAQVKNNPISDITEKLKILKKNGCYTIARIVSFKDFVRNDLAIKKLDGSVWRDKEKTEWLNPYNKEVHKYLIDISREAGKLGFDEIQYDYIRFSSYITRDKDIDSKEFDQTISRCDIINDFLKSAQKVLKPLNVKISVDVFGCVIEGAIAPASAAENSAILGQDYVSIADIADYVCPMIYPSHFAPNSMNIAKPDLEPYKVIYRALKLSEEMLKEAGRPDLQQKVRPYLQAFTAKWLKNGHYQTYSSKQVQEQINATNDAGLKQWSLFNSSGSYKLD